MKKGLILFTILSAWTISVQSQNLFKGKPLTEIFADFHYYPDNDTSTTNGFALNRAFLGWNFVTDTKFSATVIVNAGSPSELAPGSKSRRMAYFREASITWSGDRLTLSGGMTTTKGLIFQQKFLGKRYVADNFEALDGYITVADLGFTADYVINKYLKADISLMNGEGYSSMHVDNSIRSSLGFTITPFRNAVIRLYCDLDHPRGVWQNMLLGFVGYKNENITIGAELARKTNFDLINGHHAWGFSSTGAVKIFNKTELFGRYDLTSSSAETDMNQPWNYLSDRQFAVVGLQYSFTDSFRMALDYQGMFPWSGGIRDKNGIFVNAHFKIPE